MDENKTEENGESDQQSVRQRNKTQEIIMKKLMAITLLMILSTVCIFAQYGADGQELIGLDKQWSATIDHKDNNSIDALSGITAANFTSRGGTMNKAPYIEPTLKGGLQLFTTQLEGRYSSTSPWEKELSLSPIFTKIYLPWGTNRRGITSAELQMTNSPNGFSGNNPNIIASGKLNVIACDFIKLYVDWVKAPSSEERFLSSILVSNVKGGPARYAEGRLSLKTRILPPNLPKYPTLFLEGEVTLYESNERWDFPPLRPSDFDLVGDAYPFDPKSLFKFRRWKLKNEHPVR